MKNSTVYVLPHAFRNLADDRVLTSVRESSDGVKFPAYVLNLAKFIGALALSAVAGWCCTAVLSLSFDTGYETIAKFFGQPDSQQCVVASMALWFAILPFSCSFIFGWCNTLLRGSPIWGVVPSIAVLLVASADFIAENDVPSLLELAPWIAGAVVVASGGYLAGQALSKCCRKNSSMATYPIAFAAFLPAGYCIYNSLNLSSGTELAVLVAAVLLAAYSCSRASHVVKLSRAVQNSALVLTPMVLPLVLNVLANAVLLFLDQFGIGGSLGWRALAAAQVMLIVVTAAITIGSALGCERNRRLQGSPAISGSFLLNRE